MSLPEEIIILILEKACESILKDIVSPARIFNFTNQGFGRCVKPFRSLSFHRILAHCVTINGILVRDRLLSLQMENFRNSFQTIEWMLQHHPFLRTTSSDWGLSIPEILSIVGKSGTILRFWIHSWPSGFGSYVT